MAAADQASARALAAERMRALATRAAGGRADAIPDAVLQRAALVLADNIAATESEPEVRAAQARLTERTTVQEAIVFNRAK